MNFKDIRLAKDIIRSMGYDKLTKWQKDDIIEIKDIPALKN